MQYVFVIKNWEELFETSETKKLKTLRWVPVPNKHDGKSYRRIVKMKDRCDIFTAWTLILQIASKMPVRGILADEDGPLDHVDMADMTGFPEEIFSNALQNLSDSRIGWIIKKPIAELANERAAQSANSGSNTGSSPEVPADPPEDAGSFPPEGKGMKGMELKGTASHAREGSIFDLKTLEDCIKAGATIGFPKNECEIFWNKYQSKGWVDGAGIPITGRWFKLQERKGVWEREQFNRPQNASAKGAEIKSVFQADSVIEEIEANIRNLKSKINVEVKKDGKHLGWKKDQSVLDQIAKQEERLKEVRNLKLGMAA